MTTETRPRDKAPACCGVEDAGFVHVLAEQPPDETARTAAVFKALSDETRLRILKAIAHKGELCECFIVPAFGLSQPTISYHLKVLREAGLVESERRGQWVHHRVNQRALLGAVREITEIA